MALFASIYFYLLKHENGNRVICYFCKQASISWSDRYYTLTVCALLILGVISPAALRAPTALQE